MPLQRSPSKKHTEPHSFPVNQGDLGFITDLPGLDGSADDWSECTESSGIPDPAVFFYR